MDDIDKNGDGKVDINEYIGRRSIVSLTGFLFSIGHVEQTLFKEPTDTKWSFQFSFWS